MSKQDASAQRADDIYAPPQANLDRGAPYHVAGDLLVAQSPVVLPGCCVRTGSADSVVWITRKFVDRSIFTVSVIRKHCWITYGLSKEMQSRFNRRLLIARIFLGIGIATFVISCCSGNFFDSYTGFLGLFVAIIAAAVCPTFIPLTVVKTSGNLFYIKGCSREFLDSIEAVQKEDQLPIL